MTPIPHPHDPGLELVPHEHGRGFRVVAKASPDASKRKLVAAKPVAAALALLVAVGAFVCGFYRLGRIEQSLKARVICEWEESLSHE